MIEIFTVLLITIAVVALVCGVVAVLVALYRGIGSSGCLILTFLGLVAALWFVIALVPQFKIF